MNNIDELNKIKSWIKKDTRIVFLGGAGVSTLSGIPDFRSPTGLYKIKNKYGLPAETLLSHTFFIKHPDTFYDFYWNFMVYENAKPNKAHIALANYENQGGRIEVLTQNIDGLHQEAGSKRVYELHGSTKRYYCSECNKMYSLDQIEKKGIPHCQCGGILKPDVILYEEPLDENILYASVNALRYSDLLIVGGTSLNVYPAAGLIYEFGGSHKILINKESTPLDSFFDEVVNDDIGETLSYILS